MPQEFFEIIPSKDSLITKRITPEDPRFKEIVEKEQGLETRHVFGLNEINIIKKIEKEISLEKDSNPTASGEALIDNILRNSQKKLEKIASSKDSLFSDIGFEQLIYEAISDPKINKRLREIYPNAFIDVDENETFLNIEEILPDISKMPLPLYRLILENHILIYKEKEKELNEKLPAMQERLIERLKLLVLKGFLPLTIKEMEKKIKSVKVVSGDYLIYSDLVNIKGDYNPNNNIAVLPNGEVSLVRSGFNLEEYQEQVYTHEMMHALSGLSIVGRETSERGMEKADIYRMGLSTGISLAWLNEALTERLALKVTGLQDSDHYKDERKLLELLIDSGISEDLFINAYFENQTTESGPNKKSALKELIRTVNERFGQRYLQNLDKDVSKKGIEDVSKEYSKRLKA